MLLIFGKKFGNTSWQSQLAISTNVLIIIGQYLYFFICYRKNMIFEALSTKPWLCHLHNLCNWQNFANNQTIKPQENLTLNATYAQVPFQLCINMLAKTSEIIAKKLCSETKAETFRGADSKKAQLRCSMTLAPLRDNRYPYLARNSSFSSSIHQWVCLLT